MLTAPPKMHFHGYLMCKDEKLVEVAVDKMCRACAENGAAMLPCFLITKLDAEAVEQVRGVLFAIDGRIKKRITAAKQSSFSAWLMPETDPRDEELMVLH
jgi:hypothetical protein